MKSWDFLRLPQAFYISEPAVIERWRFALLFETVLNGTPDWRPRHTCAEAILLDQVGKAVEST